MPSLLRWRVMLAGLAAAAGIALEVLSRHESQSSIIGPFSPAAAAAFALTAAAVLLLAGLALAPSRHLRQCETAMRSCLLWLASREPAVRHFAAAALLVLAFASYTALTARFFALNQGPPVADQREYLVLAEQIRQSSLADLLGPGYREANRHPLYPVLLAWTGAGVTDPAAFARGKWTSVALAWLGFTVLIALVARQFSLAVAAITAVLLATNLAFQRHTTLVACEGMLVLWTGLLWLTAAAPPPQDTPRRDSLRSGPAALASRRLALGAWAGLAYLTKGSALLLLVGLIVWLIVRGNTPSPLVREGRGGRAAQWTQTPVRSVALVLLAFLVVASPLLLRNTRVYANPFYNSNTPFLFSDSFEEALRRSDPSRPADENESTWTAGRRYLRTHTTGQVLDRAVAGSVTELFILMRALGPAPLNESRALVGAAVLLLALLGMAARARGDAVLVLIWIALFIPFFGWYVPIAAGDRFVLPFVVPLYVYAATTLSRLAGATRHRKAAIVVLLAAAVWSALCVGGTLLSQSLPAAFGGCFRRCVIHLSGRRTACQNLVRSI